MTNTIMKKLRIKLGSKGNSCMVPTYSQVVGGKETPAQRKARLLYLRKFTFQGGVVVPIEQ